MKEEIIKISQKNNIDIIGFTKVDNYTELEKKYSFSRNNNYKCSFEVGSVYDKTHLKEKFNDYNSFIVIGLSYNNSINLKDKMHLSSFCFGKDYHIVLKEKMESIVSYLEQKGYKSKTFVDNNILDERYIAFKAGLGFYGKNHLLINEEYGSNFFIGIIMTDLIVEYDKQVNKSCLNCNKCINNCPTNSIKEDGINANTCLSYITQKKNITEEEKNLINNCVYGCDICSNICPYNQNKKSPNFLLDDNSIIEGEISKEKWEQDYKDKSCYWRGLEVLNRNIKTSKEKLEK